MAPTDPNALTPQDIVLVRGTWLKVLPIADTAIDMFYRRLFEVAPQVRPLFPKNMKKQKKKLLQMLGTAVAKLDRLDEIVEDVRACGVRHVGYGAEPAHYEVVGQCLLWTLREALGNRFSAEANMAWAKAYATLGNVMIAAAEEATPAAA